MRILNTINRNVMIRITLTQSLNCAIFGSLRKFEQRVPIKLFQSLFSPLSCFFLDKMRRDTKKNFYRIIWLYIFICVCFVRLVTKPHSLKHNKNYKTNVCCEHSMHVVQCTVNSLGMCLCVSRHLNE